MEYVLKTNGLVKTYGKKDVVSEVAMNVPKGSIYGLIGENGAGKTTIMRMIVGLAKPTKGSVQLFETDDLVEARKKVGCVIENPALYPNMSARENLETFRRLSGIEDKGIIDSVLETVGLADTGKKKAKNFSLGMKQRLSIGIAILNNPEFLILDEPINGLDPKGIAEVRDLLNTLCSQGKTILLSSHILGELFKVATHYGVISNGKLISEMDAAQLEAQCKDSIKFIVDNVDKAKEVLKSEFGASDFNVEDRTLIVKGFEDKAALMNAALCKAGIMVEHVSYQGIDLENYFIELMRGENA